MHWVQNERQGFIASKMLKEVKIIKTARRKLLEIIDKNSFRELDNNFITNNPIDFEDYNDKCKKAFDESGEKNSVICGMAKINSVKCIVFILDSNYMQGSIGIVEGEKIAHAFEIATQKKLPIVSFSASSGMRLQEGALALFQMVKMSCAVYKHSKCGLLYVSVIFEDTLGGVTASFASLADIIIAEEKAKFGFTGKRIIEETLREELPHDFQKACYVKRAGQVDMVVANSNLRGILSALLSTHCFGDKSWRR